MTRSVSACLRSLANQPIIFVRLAVVLVVLAQGAVVPLARPQAVTPPKPLSFYKSLDLQAAATESSSISSLFTEIHNRNLFGPIPQSILDRMVRAQLAFIHGKQAPITEDAVASAINAMGKDLDSAAFTGTNTRQVRLVRIGLLPSFPTLLATGSPRPLDRIVANDLSPAGAVYLGLLIVRQKLANPAWFDDPEKQNERWVRIGPKTAPGGATATTRLLRVDEEPPEQTNLRLMLQKGLLTEGSATTKAYHHFLNLLGITR